jgi:hypothetical protein
MLASCACASPFFETTQEGWRKFSDMVLTAIKFLWCSSFREREIYKYKRLLWISFQEIYKENRERRDFEIKKSTDMKWGKRSLDIPSFMKETHLGFVYGSQYIRTEPESFFPFLAKFWTTTVQSNFLHPFTNMNCFETSK